MAVSFRRPSLHKPITDKSEKNIRQIPIGSCPIAHLTAISQKCPGHQKESLENGHSREKPKESWLVKAMWYRGWDPETKKKGH